MKKWELYCGELKAGSVAEEVALRSTMPKSKNNCMLTLMGKIKLQMKKCDDQSNTELSYLNFWNALYIITLGP